MFGFLMMEVADEDVELFWLHQFVNVPMAPVSKSPMPPHLFWLPSSSQQASSSVPSDMMSTRPFLTIVRFERCLAKLLTASH